MAAVYKVVSIDSKKPTHYFWTEPDLYNFGEPVDELMCGQSIKKVEVNVYPRRLAIQASG